MPFADKGSIKLSDVKKLVREKLGLGLNFQGTIKHDRDSFGWVKFHTSFDGIYCSPYAGRVQLSIEQALPHTEDLWRWFSQTIPDLPQRDDQELKNFWAAIIGNDDVADQMFNAFKRLHTDRLNLVPQVQGIVHEIRATYDDHAAQGLQTAIEQLDKVVKEILSAQPPAPKSFLTSTREGLAQVAGSDDPEAKNAQTMLDLLDALSPSTNAWLEQLLAYMSQHLDTISALQLRLREYLWQHVQHDHYHYLLFGQTAESLVPRAWIEASWSYIQRFRCNFGFFVTEAMLYPTITVVGTPDIAVPVTEDEEAFLREYVPQSDSFQFERLWVRSADELKAILAERIAKNNRFEGGNVGPHAPA